MVAASTGKMASPLEAFVDPAEEVDGAFNRELTRTGLTFQSGS
jgi:hypothetical protein